MIAAVAAGEAPRYDFRVLSVITRLATDPGLQYKGADVICVREKMCVCLRCHGNHNPSRLDWIRIQLKKRIVKFFPSFL